MKSSTMAGRGAAVPAAATTLDEGDGELLAGGEVGRALGVATLEGELLAGGEADI